MAKSTYGKARSRTVRERQSTHPLRPKGHDPTTSTPRASAKSTAQVTHIDPDRLPLAPNCVTIFGAGIAGLTAAHELVERGFQVQVWEKAIDERYPERGCNVGGLARTQWSAVNWPEERDVSHFEQDETRRLEQDGAIDDDSDRAREKDVKYFEHTRTRPITSIPERIYLRFWPGKFEPEVPCKNDESSWWWLDECLNYLIDERKTAAGGGTTPEACTITVYAHGGIELSADERKRRAFVFCDELRKAFKALKYENVEISGFSPDKEPPPKKRLGAKPVEFSWREFCGDIVNVGATLHVEVVVADSDDPDFVRVQIDWLDNARDRKLLRTTRLRRHWWPEALDSVSLDPKADLLRALGRLTKPLDKGVIYVEVSASQISRLSVKERNRRTKQVQDLFKKTLTTLAPTPGQSATANPPGNTAVKDAQADSGDEFTYPLTWKVGSTSMSVTLRLVHIDELPYKVYDDVPEDIEVVIGFRPRERWLPGEHGYRFFPSFYHHIFDTMQRTPLLELVRKPDFAQAQERAIGIATPEPQEYTESGRVVMDNVHPTSSTVLAFTGGQRPSQVSRTSVRSFEELRTYLEVLFGSRDDGGLGFEPRDVARITLKLLKFATACDARRRQYEELSWWDFLEADTFSPEAQDTTERIPQALVAMSARESDARTQWIPVSQILLDEVRTDTYRDGTLRGPTTEAWLIPWRRYLEAQGVEFIRGELEGFDLVTQERNGQQARIPWPRVNCRDLRYPAEQEGNEKDGTRRPFLRPGYFILAISADQMRKVADDYARLSAKLADDDAVEQFFVKGSDLDRCRSIGGLEAGADLATALEEPHPDNCDFRHFAGIQYYFAEDVFWVDGHVYYPDAPWRLSSISQARFWQEKMDWEHGYRGVLSVIVGAWDEEGSNGKTAWECNEQELAQEVWSQIKESITEERMHGDGVGRFVRRTPDQKLPEPIFWHIDDGLRATKAGKKKFYENDTPFLVNGPGQFEGRPGSLEPEVGYSVEHGLVVAGYYTKTFTRIPSMEAANESARHAVNAILRHLDAKGDGSVKVRRTFCDVWSPEDREIDDLKFLKELDAKLVARNLPHLLDIFDLDYLAQHLLRGGSRDPLDPLRLLARLRRLYRDVAE